MFKISNNRILTFLNKIQTPSLFFKSFKKEPKAPCTIGPNFLPLTQTHSNQNINDILNFFICESLPKIVDIEPIGQSPDNL